MSIVLDSERHVSRLLSEQLTENHRYHNLPHTLSVLYAARQLAGYFDISEEEREVLDLAALFHDTGFIRDYDNHEEESIRLAGEFLRSQHYCEGRLERVQACILATKVGEMPQNRLQAILKDADLSNLGRADYLTTLENLRHEWDVFCNRQYTDAEWYDLNRKFLKQHYYYTEAARSLYGKQLADNAEMLKVMAKDLKKDGARAGDKIDKITTSRSAQMMVKTALRNHLDLSNLADNKANIMLSINALIITVAMPLGATRVQEFPYLLPALLVLLLTCLTSMIFATLATRPIHMHGKTTQEAIAAGEANLFFFGNFFKMSFPEYRTGLQRIIAEEANLEANIMRDLYHLGRSLGNKYVQLRICYNIFLGGVILTVIVFCVSYLLYY